MAVISNPRQLQDSGKVLSCRNCSQTQQKIVLQLVGSFPPQGCVITERGEERGFDSVSFFNLYFFCSVSDGSHGLWVKPACHIPRVLGPVGPTQKGIWSPFLGSEHCVLCPERFLQLCSQVIIISRQDAGLAAGRSPDAAFEFFKQQTQSYPLAFRESLVTWQREKS